MPSGIGIVLALPSEARIFSGFRKAGRLGGFPFWLESRALSDPASVCCILSGPGPERADRAARILLDQGVQSLVSTGVSGGTSPDLLPGELILAETISGLSGQYASSAALTEELRKILSEGGVGIRRGLILSRPEPVTDAEAKRRIFRKTGALAVDMESAAVSAAADQMGREFAALRVVCDPAAMSLPFEPARVLKPDGNIRYGSLAAQMIVSPAGLFGLYQTGRAFSKAMTSLGRAWKTILKRC